MFARYALLLGVFCCLVFYVGVVRSHGSKLRGESVMSVLKAYAQSSPKLVRAPAAALGKSRAKSRSREGR